jgi:thioredoxin 2
MTGDKVKISCLECGATNHYPLDSPGKKVVCGKCKAALPRPGTVIEPTRAQASALFQNSSLPLLVDFFSETCGPCHMMHPVLERLAHRRAGDIMVLRVDVEKETEMAREFGVRAVPTFVIVLKGVERGRTAGAMSEENFALWVASQA